MMWNVHMFMDNADIGPLLAVVRAPHHKIAVMKAVHKLHLSDEQAKDLAILPRKKDPYWAQ